MASYAYFYETTRLYFNLSLTHSLVPYPYSQTDDPVISEEEEVELTADELDYENYLDQLLAIAQYEEKAFSALPSTLYISSSNRKSLFLKFNNTVVPNYTKYVSQLKQIKPENAELQKIHTKLTRGSYNQLEGYLLYKRALSKYTINRTLLTQGNAKVKTAKNGLNSLRQNLMNMLKSLAMNNDVLSTGIS